MLDGFHEGFIPVCGNRIFYRTRGTPEKGTVLLVHGGPGANHLGMLPFADLGQFGYRLVWYDQSGCGRSQRPRDPANYTLDRRAEEAEGVRRALRLGKVHLVGHSFGVPIAIMTALRFQRSLRSLTLGSGYASSQWIFDEGMRQFYEAPKRLRSVIERFERVGDIEDPRYLKAREDYNRLPHRTSEGRPALVSRLRVLPWEMTQMAETMNPRLEPLFVGDAASRFLAPVGGSMKDWDVSSRLGEIRIPTLVTVGRFDILDPSLSRRIHRGIPGSKLVIFGNSGHATMFDERDHYMSTMRDFLDGVKSHSK